MSVGVADKLTTHLVGNYSAGRHFGKWAHVEAESNFRSSAVFLVNGSNNPVEEGSGLLEVEFVNRTTGVEEVAVNVLSGDLTPELFLAVPTAGGVDVYVYIREYRTLYISLVSLTPHSTISWMNEDTGSTEPADAVYATRTNNASGAEYLSRYAFLSAGASQTGWWKLGSLNLDEMPNNSNRSCSLLVNGVYANQSLAGAAESGLLEFDVRKGSVSAAGLSILNGNLNAEEFCVVLSQAEATVYINLPSQYNSFAVTMLSEDSASASKASPLFEFDIQFMGTSAPSGAQYAVVRNIASRAEADSEGNVINETYATLDELSEAEDTMQKGLTAEAAARAAAIENIVEGTTVVGKATADGNGNNIVSTYATKAALDTGLAGKANTSGSYPNMTVGSATSAGTADGLNLPDAVAYTVLKASNYYLASKLTDMGYGVFLITVGIKTNSTYGYGDTFSGVVAVDHQASGAGGNTNPFMFSGIIQSPTNPSGEQAILRVRAMSGLGAIMIETLNSSGAVVDPDTILTDPPSLSVRKLIAL